MKFWGIFRFEFGYQIRRAWPWLIFAVVLITSFLMTRDAAVSDALYDELMVNAPFSIAITTVVGGLVWLLSAAAIAGEAAGRDVATRMYPLVYTTPISKAEHLGGRFLAALAINALILLAVQLGAILAIYSPGVNAALIGPFRPAAYLTAYAYLSLPNAFFATALQFMLASRTGRPMTSYVGSLVLVFMGFFIASLVLYSRELGTLVDPIGIRFIVEDIAHLWTVAEKGTRLLTFDGIILRNRVAWLGVGVAAIIVNFVSFRFAHRTEGGLFIRLMRRRAADSPAPARLGVVERASICVPEAPRAFDFAFHVRKTLALAVTSFRSIAWSGPGLALLVFIPLLMVIATIDQLGIAGVPLIPNTARVLEQMTSPLSDEMARWVIIPLLLVFLAGELVWHERDAGVSDLVDAMPGSDWAPLLGKLLGLTLVLALFMILLTGAGMLAQTLRGYNEYEIGLYLRTLVGLQLPEYLVFGVLAVVVHVFVNSKYIGHLVNVIAYVFIVVLAGMIGIEHNMLVYGAGPWWKYTEMLGFGSTVVPWLWFKLYWAAWALMLCVAAQLLWIRGKESSLRARFAEARRRLTGHTAWIGGTAALLILALGGFVFYNTNVLHEYLSSQEVSELRAEYERRYRRFEEIPQPQPTSATMRVELHPARKTADVRGSYSLLNSSSESIDSIHVVVATGTIRTGPVTFDRKATLAVNDEEHGYRIYLLGEPLQPGDSMRMNFEVDYSPRGFRNGGTDTSVQPSGTAFNSTTWFPFIGYQRTREVILPRERREHGLPPRPILASLSAAEGDVPTTRGAGVMFDAVIGTDADQVAVAPGSLRRTWTENGRRYFHYTTDAPIGSEWAFFSANYAVREGRWNNVAIRIFHHPGHTRHVDGMMHSARASLDFYSKQFGPYPYDNISLVEHPGAPGNGAHADAGMISYGEGWAYWIAKEKRLDFPYAIVAHEMGHQWTLPYAMVEGLPFLSEGLATFSAIQVMKEARGIEQGRRFVSQLRQPFPYKEIRRGEPLLRALDPYLAYRRGPFAMVALTEYVGTEQVNGAIRRLIATHEAPRAPQATTMHLYRELQAVTPDSLKYLLHDLFEVNTYWRFRLEKATAKQVAGGWQVTMNVHARKEVFDSAGVGRELKMDEWIEIGIFENVPDGEWDLSRPMYLAKHRVRSGTQTLTVTVPNEPRLAGIDPFHVLDWEEREDDDNTNGVKIESSK